ncbi:hypothetical protein BDK51DRAFT_32653, partial [Blyttiomyces helicus]
MFENPHAAISEAALARIKDLYADREGLFQFHSNAKGTKISTAPAVAPSNVPITRGEVTITGFTKEQIATVINDQAARKVWDGRLEFGEVLEQFGEHAVVMYSKQRGTWPV